MANSSMNILVNLSLFCALSLLIPRSFAVTGSFAYFADDFDEADGSSSGNKGDDEGSELWSSKWSGSAPDGVSFGQSANCVLSSNCLRLDSTTSENSVSSKRKADLSGAKSASLTFKYNVLPTLDNSRCKLHFNDGASWVLISNLQPTNGVILDQTFSIPSSFFASTFRLRFRSVNGAETYIDDVVINVEYDDPGSPCTGDTKQFVISGGVDTSIKEDDAATSHGDDTSITVDDSPKSYALLKFININLPTGASLQSATLRIFCHNQSNGPVSAYPMETHWNDGVTWAEFGLDGPQTGTHSSSVASFTLRDLDYGEFVSVDVTPDVIAWLGGAPNEGWVFINSLYDGFDFYSSEYNDDITKIPQLNLVYTETCDPTDAPAPTPMPTLSPHPPTSSMPTPSPHPPTSSMPTPSPHPPSVEDLPCLTIDSTITEGVDTYVWRDEPDSFFGGSATISVDKSDGGDPTYGLLKFSIDLPTSASLESAKLQLYTTNESPGLINAYRMNKAWDGASSWNSLGSGGIQTDDNDASSTASFSIDSPDDDTLITVDVTADVQAWLSGTPNQGWLFINDASNGWDFGSFEQSSFTQIPKLIVVYNQDCAPGESPVPAPTLPPTPAPTPTFANGPVLSQGCGQEASFIGYGKESISSSGKSREYYISVPSDYNPNKDYGVVFGYHGRNSDGSAMQGYLDLEEIQPQANNYIFVYPTAARRDWPYFSGFGYERGWLLGQTADNEDHIFFDDVLDEVADNYCVNLARIYVTGQSWGGDMATSLPCARGNKIAAAIAVEPYSASIFTGRSPSDVFPAIQPSDCERPLPMITMNGVKSGFDAWKLADWWHDVNECTSPTQSKDDISAIGMHKDSGCAAPNWYFYYENPTRHNHDVPDQGRYEQMAMDFFEEFRLP